MVSIKDIEDAVAQLGPGDLARFRAWFAEFDAASWDRQFERDAAGGKLDAVAEKAARDLRKGKCREL